MKIKYISTILIFSLLTIFCFGQKPSNKIIKLQVAKLIKSFQNSDTVLFESLFVRTYLPHRHENDKVSRGPTYYDTKNHLADVIANKIPLESILVYDSEYQSDDNEYKDIKIDYNVTVRFKLKTKKYVFLVFNMINYKGKWLIDPEILLGD